MITPRFQLEQTDKDLIITIYAPYASLSDSDIHADQDTFCFYASPFYLRLHLPGLIEETDASKGSYDVDSGVFKICVQKVNEGEHFPDLDFITSVLTPCNSKKYDIKRPKVEVIGGNDDENDEEEDDEDDWYLNLLTYEDPSEEFLILAPKYGFANQSCGVFLNFTSEFAGVIDLPHPDKTPATERARLRFEQENTAFSDDHYLADWVQTEEMEPILNYKHPWQGCIDGNLGKFSEKDLDIMKDLPKKEFLLDSKEECASLFSLVDILFAYCYNARTTCGENTVESAWTINKLSATLSWLQSFLNLKEAVATSVRRSLCFPLYRHWDLAMAVINDVKDIIKLGKHQILKILLEVYSMFNLSEPRYILNQLYIRDYCVWIQQVPEKRIRALSHALGEVALEKSDIGFDLEELEYAAEIVQQEEFNPKSPKEADNKTVDKQLSDKLNVLKLEETCGAYGDESDSSSDELDSSSSSSELDSDDLDSDDLS